ncbi:MAG: hypothetical protein JNL81_11990 [Hyphomonadaceae bacterium]|nr:hypothetical protein [Hyphomonadaceae bacterium]
MLSRILPALVLLCLAACAPQPRQLTLYSASAETRVFSNPVGFAFPDGVSLEHIFDQRSGELLSVDEAASVASAVSVVPPPSEVAACAHVWRHAFVFYDAEGVPLGALAYCAECGAVVIIGPEDPGVGLERLRYNGAELNRIIEAHGLTVEPEYPE